MTSCTILSIWKCYVIFVTRFTSASKRFLIYLFLGHNRVPNSQGLHYWLKLYYKLKAFRVTLIVVLTRARALTTFTLHLPTFIDPLKLSGRPPGQCTMFDSTNLISSDHIIILTAVWDLSETFSTAMENTLKAYQIL